MGDRLRHIGGNRGAITLRTLIWTLLIILGGYAGYLFGMPYVGYYMLKTDIEQEAKNAHMYSDEALAKRILDKASTWSVPLSPENLIVERGLENDTIRIRARYKVTVTVIEDYERILSFKIDVEEPLKDSSRVLQ